MQDKRSPIACLCFDNELGAFMSNPAGDIFRADFSGAKDAFYGQSKQAIDQVSVDCKRVYKTSIDRVKLVDSSFFEGQSVLQLFLYQNVFKKRVLVIFTPKCVYWLPAEDARSEKNSRFRWVQSQVTPKRLFSVDELSKWNSAWRDFEIIGSQIQNGTIYLNLQNQATQSLKANCPEHPLHMLLRLTLEEGVASKADTGLVDSFIEQENALEVRSIASLKVFIGPVANCHASRTQPNEVFFSVQKKLYKGLFEEDGLGDFENPESQPRSRFAKARRPAHVGYKLVYKNKIEIAHVQFWEDMSRVLILDKVNRVALVELASGLKELVFQIQRGEIETFVWHSREKTLFVYPIRLF